MKLETLVKLTKENDTHGSIAKVKDGAREEGRVPHQRRYVLWRGILEAGGKYISVVVVT